MKNRRDEKTMLNLIVQAAKNDKRIRAVIMNGSRASPSAKKDIFQDYDIVYLVTDVEPFVDDKNWVRQFGELLIMQMPEEMDGNWPRSKDKYVYLMQFKDWNRIDLTLLHINRLKTMPRDSQSILLLDKDQLIESFDPSDNDYLPKPPAAKDYFDCCNEFLWVSTYVAKGLWRKQITYTKHVSEQVVKEELIRMLTWYIGIQTGFNKSLGVYGKYIENYLEPKVWQTFLQTYVDADFKNMWASLFKMCELFYDLAIKVSHYFGFPFNGDEFENVMAYLHEVKDNMYQHE
ncbi:aminoglycoside 6-adenylyltransferase [Legionella longbeachae]|uniref:Putative aminoglycoside 6-adenylyltransferase n=1 Tax=Legionella longbeachae serogroup 1 (strain NSW150) TaxID=661367 RepID=D3HMA9_LEGLN|nr:aminoglycoside 6-adenylyltransferase [Legionella longbeachae]QIN37027.1 aminoglycoside 6-adenylyltransferase [Legionella longbeachae]CBJ13598.1 putative aminoglycoside 6-adenylyltransferase [Legionella longbeachae NSW150]HBD7397198.1 aminoglycoside 6-adenylyltransferase [Legionella pneumophila]